MRIFRLAMPEERGYLMVNNYFYKVIDKDWTNTPQGVTIHACVVFLSEVLDSSKRTLDPSILRSRLTRLVEEHFPVLLPYLQLEYESLGLSVPDSHFRADTQLDLGFFKRSIEFYRVSSFTRKHNL